MKLFDIEETPWPSWYRPTKGRNKANARVRQGKHPATGEELGPEDKRCRDCVFHGRNPRGFPRCGLNPRAPRTMNGDVPGRWRSCCHFDGGEG